MPKPKPKPNPKIIAGRNNYFDGVTRRKKFKKLNKDIITHCQFIASFAAYTHSKTIVEIGVQYGDTFVELCKVAEMTDGKVFGYDFFAPIDAYAKRHAGRISRVMDILEDNNIKESSYKLTTIDTTGPNFPGILNNDTSGSIDFAFIDGDHSYDGVTKDFLNVYPYMNVDGSIIFHDTFSHIGLRKFVLDLYGELNDGTFDIINLPFGAVGDVKGNRHGLTILTKRSYPLGLAQEEIFAHDRYMSFEDIYEKEAEWYKEQTELWTK